MEENMQEWIPLLSELVNKYTSFGSTSVTYETARQLMESIQYCVHEASAGGDHRQTELIGDQRDVKELYEIGLVKAKEKIEQARTMYREIRKSFCDYDNVCYSETIIKGMPSFFERYDIRFDARNHILTLDYPLLIEMKDMVGIDLIYEYLRRIRLEQLFLNGFTNGTVTALLSRFHERYADLFVNICKVVLRNAIGCMFVDKPFQELCIEVNDIDTIRKAIDENNIDELNVKMKDMLTNFISIKYKGNHDLCEYLCLDLKEFVFELKSCAERNCLEQLFPVTHKGKVETDIWFEDGLSIEDEKLRKLIEEMGECRFLSDKIDILKENIKSLTDLKEVLKECFFSGEFEEVFQILSNDEIKVLKDEIALKLDFGDELYEWERAFLESRQ